MVGMTQGAVWKWAFLRLPSTSPDTRCRMPSTVQKDVRNCLPATTALSCIPSRTHWGIRGLYVKKSGVGKVLKWRLNIDTIDRARILRGLTVAALARSAKVDRRTVHELLHGRRRPTFGSIQALRTTLGLEWAEVIVFDDDANLDGTDRSTSR